MSGIFESPGQAKQEDGEGMCWGANLAPQQCGYIVMAISGGRHFVSEIVQYIGQVDHRASMTQYTCGMRCKQMALTGLLVPFIEPLGEGRYRWAYFIRDRMPSLDGDEWGHLLSIEQVNERCEDEEPRVIRWIKRRVGS